MRAYLKKIIGAMTAGVIAVGALPANVSAKDVSSMTPQEMTADMGVGWNLGNTLDAYDGSGLDTEISWSNPKATKELIDAVKAKGFTTIRVPVTWRKHMDANYTVDGAWMARVKEVVDYAIDDNTYVILNVHHDFWNRPVPSNYDAASKELKILWKQIAKEFGGYDRHLIFEGMNEPRNYDGSDEWNGGTDEMRDVVNKLNKDFVDTVRATGGKNKDRCLMIPTYAASATTAAMSALTFPNNDPNLIASIHAYAPYDFTMNPGGTDVFDAQQESNLAGQFKDIDNCLVSQGHAVVIGEFSASNKSGKTDERVKWAKSYAKKAKELGVSIVLWDNNKPTNGADNTEAHGYIDRNTCQWYSVGEPVVDAVIETYTGTKPKQQTEIKPSGDEQVITSNKLTASNYDPSGAVQFDFSKLVNGSFIALTYTSGDIPTLIVQDNKPHNAWAKVSATKVQNGVAYYSAEDIASAYAGAYQSAYGSAPSSRLYNAYQFFVSAEGGNVTVTKMSFIPKAKETPVSKADSKTDSKPDSKVEPVDLSKCSISVAQSEVLYTGKENKPAVTVKNGSRKLTEGKDYAVKYENNVNVGTAKITVTGKGNCTGSVVKEFKITDPKDFKFSLGDVNLDGSVDVTDIGMVASHIKGVKALSSEGMKAADVDRNNDINVTDISMIASHIKGIKALS